MIGAMELWSECVVEIWWWLRFCDGGGRGRWMGFVIWKRKEQWRSGGAVAREIGGERESNKAEKWVERKRESGYKVRLLREIIKKLMRVNILLKYLVK